MEDIEEIWVGGRYVGYRVVSRGPAQVITTTKMTRGKFIDRIPSEKHAALIELTKTDPMLAAAKHKLDIRDYIDIEDPQTIMFVVYMKMIGQLTEAEGDAMLAPIDITDPGAVI